MTTATKTKPEAKAPAKKSTAKKAPAKKKGFELGVARHQLLAALHTATQAVSKEGGIPALTGVHLSIKKNVLTVRTTDMEMAISVAIKVDGPVAAEVLVPALLFRDVVKACPHEAIRLLTVDGELQIVAKDYVTMVRTLDVTQFPVFFDIDDKGTEVAAQPFREGIRMSYESSSKEDARPVLSGVLLEPTDGQLAMVATDSYRLAVVQGGDAPFTEKTIVPRRAMQAVLRAIGETGEKLTVMRDDRTVGFRCAGVTIAVRYINGEFPNYRNLIPDVGAMPVKVVVNRQQLVASIDRLRPIMGSDLPLRLRITAKTMKLYAVSQDIGNCEDRISCDHNGNLFEVAFNPDYFQHAVKVFTGDDIELRFTDAMKPGIVVDASSQDNLMLVMPTRVP